MKPSDEEMRIAQRIIEDYDNQTTNYGYCWFCPAYSNDGSCGRVESGMPNYPDESCYVTGYVTVYFTQEQEEER